MYIVCVHKPIALEILVHLIPTPIIDKNQFLILNGKQAMAAIYKQK